MLLKVLQCRGQRPWQGIAQRRHGAVRTLACGLTGVCLSVPTACIAPKVTSRAPSLYLSRGTEAQAGKSPPLLATSVPALEGRASLEPGSSGLLLATKGAGHVLAWLRVWDFYPPASRCILHATQ